MKIVINPSYGGFSPEYKVVMRYAELKGIALYPGIDRYETNKKHKRIIRKYNEEENNEMFLHYYTVPIADIVELDDVINYFFPSHDIPRNDPEFVQAVEEAGPYVTGLKVVEIPDDVEWEIEEYDGAEWVSEKHRTWS